MEIRSPKAVLTTANRLRPRATSTRPAIDRATFMRRMSRTKSQGSGPEVAQSHGRCRVAVLTTANFAKQTCLHVTMHMVISSDVL